VPRASVCASIGCRFSLRIMLVCVWGGYGVSVVSVICELDLYNLYLGYLQWATKILKMGIKEHCSKQISNGRRTMTLFSPMPLR
jgi:hypothetical protein